MKLLEAMINSLPGIKEAVSPDTFGVAGLDPDNDSYQYRSLGSGNNRDMDEHRLSRASAVAYWLWLTNPYAKRGINLLNDFIVGSGPVIKANDPAVQYILDDFWNKSPWSFNTRIDEYITVLNLFGELVLPFEVNEKGGFLSIAYIDPNNIKEVTLKANNALQLDKVILKSQNEQSFQVLTDCEQRENGRPLKQGVFVAQTNKLLNATRGYGVLNACIDILQSLDDFTFSEIERTAMLKNFVWDVELEGMDETKIQQWVNTEQAAPPKPGSVRGHNEKVKWNAVTPDLKAADSAHLFKLLFNSVAVGMEVPEHWLGAVGFDLNKATASEMNQPVFKRLERRQAFVKSFFKLMLDYVIETAKFYKRQTPEGNITDKIDLDYSISFPEVSPKDQKDLVLVLKEMTASLMMAQSNGYLSDKQAREVWKGFVDRDMGIEIPEDEEFDNEQDDVEKIYNDVANKTA